ncbi:hypothetical protein ACE7GA_04095 [Roseomonas sp. CCTCC AB2023176]|uniref:hypothetical protein n=1 Tax=Roseomonas sp. CCTCC AB2023176 TaxID=3342640 RepID=UPI0035DEE8C5
MRGVGLALLFCLAEAAAASGPAPAAPALPPTRLSDYVHGLVPCRGYAEVVPRNCTMRLAYPATGMSELDAALRVASAAPAQAVARAERGDLAGALELIPRDGLLRAHLRRAAGDLAGALAELEDLVGRAGPAGPSRDALADLCAVRLRLGDREGAIAACDRALAHAEFTVDPLAYVRIVNAGLGLAIGDRARAEREFEALGRRDDGALGWPLTMRVRGWLRTVKGDVAGAARDVAGARARPQVEAEVFELFGVVPPEPPARAPARPGAERRR